MDSSPSAPPSVEQAFEVALLSDVGTRRPDNEDSCGHFIESPDSVVFAVADGVGGYEGGEIASRMAVDILLEAYRESPSPGARPSDSIARSPAPTSAFTTRR